LPQRRWTCHHRGFILLLLWLLGVSVMMIIRAPGSRKIAL
jgi:hypothetical protein